MLQNLEAVLYAVTQGSIYDLRDKQQLLELSLVIQAIVVFGFSITAFLVSATANAGFNVVLTAFLNAGYIVGGIYALKRKSLLAMGYMIGLTLSMAALDLTTAVYWGQLSKCSKLPDGVVIDQYSCHDRPAYRAVCAFSSILLFMKIAFCVGLVQWRRELVDETASYDRLPQNIEREKVASRSDSFDVDFAGGSKEIVADSFSI